MNGKSLGKCIVCKSDEGKYRCPKCKLITCCLKCCKEHKTANNCNGIKDKVKYIPLSDMTGNTLRKDMKLLVDISQKLDISSREPLLHQYQSRDTNNRFRSLCSASRLKQIRLFLQPCGMEKHQNNCTHVVKENNNKIINWTISIQFNKYKLILNDINENKILLNVLQNLNKERFKNINKNIKKIEYKTDILMKYNKYFNNKNLIHLPISQNHNKNKYKKIKKRNNPQNIARSVIYSVLIPNLWNIVKPKTIKTKLKLKKKKNVPFVDAKDKLNIILKIPNHFMYIRINPMLSLLNILKKKIINEYPEFIVLTPDEMKNSEYVVTDYLNGKQFENAIKRNTKIDQQRTKLKNEMWKDLNDKKLFNKNKRNYYNKYNKNNNNNRKKSFNNYNKNKFDDRPKYNNNIKARDLFNGNLVQTNNKRTINELDQQTHYKSNEPPYKRGRYQNHNNQQQLMTYPNNPNNYHVKQNVNNNNQAQSNNNDWYMYL